MKEFEQIEEEIQLCVTEIINTRKDINEYVSKITVTDDKEKRNKYYDILAQLYDLLDLNNTKIHELNDARISLLNKK